MEDSDLLPESSYDAYDSGEYRFLVDNTMGLSNETIIKILTGLFKILDDDNAMKQYLIDTIEWVKDVGVHVNLCINEINCIIIMKNGRQLKFLKLFNDNIQKIIERDIKHEDNDVYRVLDT